MSKWETLSPGWTAKPLKRSSAAWGRSPACRRDRKPVNRYVPYPRGDNRRPLRNSDLHRRSRRGSGVRNQYRHHSGYGLPRADLCRQRAEHRKDTARSASGIHPLSLPRRRIHRNRVEDSRLCTKPVQRRSSRNSGRRADIPGHHRPAPALRLTADVRFQLSDPRKICVLPYNAIGQDEEGEYVYLLEDGAAVKHKIFTGAEFSDGTEVIKGATINDKVFLDPEDISLSKYVRIEQ